MFNKTAGTPLITIKLFGFCNSTGFHTSAYRIEQIFQGKIFKLLSTVVLNSRDRQGNLWLP